MLFGNKKRNFKESVNIYPDSHKKEKEKSKKEKEEKKKKKRRMVAWGVTNPPWEINRPQPGKVFHVEAMESFAFCTFQVTKN